MIKLTQNSLDRLMEIFTLSGYTIRNEKGNFKSGSCLIESGKLIMLNKFSPVEARVTFLLEALTKIQIDETHMDDRRKAFLQEALTFKSEDTAEVAESETTDTQSAESPQGQ